MFPTFKLTTALSLVLASLVSAEQHVVVFNNRCGFGTPVLAQPSTSTVLYRSSGPVHGYDAFVLNNSLSDFVAYLSSGTCTLTATGNNCTVVRGKLALPGQGGSSATVDSAAPYADSFPTTVLFTGGSDPGCYTGGSSQPNTTVGPFNCPTTNDVNIAIQFC